VKKSDQARARRELARRAARDNFEAFFRTCPPSKPYFYGKHTVTLAKELNRVTKRLEKGLSTFLIVNMPVRHGKPLAGDTLVQMADGSRKRLDAVHKGDMVITHTGAAKTVIATYAQGTLPVLKIATNSGILVDTAYDHTFLTPDGWKQAGDLCVGNALGNLIDREYIDGTDESKAAFRLAGYIVGDGSTASTGGTFNARVSCIDEIEAADIAKCVDELGFTLRTNPKRPQELMFSNGIREWLVSIGLDRKNSYTKRVPEFVFKGSNAKVAEFIGAYFACDGSAGRNGRTKSPCAEFYSVSKGLLDDVRHLLLRFGVRTRLRVKRGRYKGSVHYSWRLGITNPEDIARFAASIPVHHTKGAEVRSWSTSKTEFRGNILADKIESIAPDGERECFCLTVADDETFIANDIIVHNSDLTSRRWPVWHLARNPNDEAMMLAHNDSLAIGFSRSARACFREYASPLFGLHLSSESAAVKSWEIEGKSGKYQAAGIHGDVVGHGGHIIVIDDYHHGRDEANSRLMRDKVWDAFTDNILTRRAPVCGLVISATRWHEDDLVGRIKNRNDPKHKDYNPEFPAFKIVTFPAHDADGNWLFPERFPTTTYTEARAALSPHAWTSEYMQDPVPRSGNLLHAEKVIWHDPAEFWKLVRDRGIRMRWGWDLASTSKEVSRGDPDNSCGTFAGVDNREIWIGRCIADQWRGPERDAVIRECALSTPGAEVIVEVVAGYKDAYEHVADMLRGTNNVTAFHPVHDKGARAECLEAPFSADLVHACRGDWMEPWKTEMLAFPGGTHDDRVDSLVTAVHDLLTGTVGGLIDFDW